MESLDLSLLLLLPHVSDRFSCPRANKVGGEDYDGKKIITCMDESFIIITVIFHKKINCQFRFLMAHYRTLGSLSPTVVET